MELGGIQLKRFLKFIFLLAISVNFIAVTSGKIIKANENIASTKQVDRFNSIKQNGVLTVLSPDMPPYSYKSSKDGEFCGIDAEIIREIARRLGINRVEAKYIAFPYLIEEVTKNPQIDLLAQGIFITDERKQLVNFSNPIYTEVDGILARKDSNINSKSDLKNKKIGVISCTVYETMAEKWKQQGVIKDYVKFYDSNSLEVALESNVIDAMLTSSIVEEDILYQKPNLNFKLLSPSQYKPELNFSVGYAFKKEDTELLNAINEKLVEMKNDGTIYQILAKNGVSSHYIP